MQNQTMIQKSEDKAEVEKRIISELWTKTEKDGNEYGILIGSDIKVELIGNSEEIDSKAWKKAIWTIYDNPKIAFNFFHTHGEWDSPLSGDDIATFLYIRNLYSMIAITEKRKYTIKRTEKTPVMGYNKREEIIAKFEEYQKAHMPPDKLNDEYYFYIDAFRQALCDAARQLAHEYKFIYEEEELK